MGSLTKAAEEDRAAVEGDEEWSDEPVIYVNGVRRVLPDGLAHLTLLQYLRGRARSPYGPVLSVFPSLHCFYGNLRTSVLYGVLCSVPERIGLYCTSSFISTRKNCFVMCFWPVPDWTCFVLPLYKLESEAKVIGFLYLLRQFTSISDMPWIGKLCSTTNQLAHLGDSG